MPAPTIGSAAHGWALRIIVALTPLWLIGSLDRDLWTPDEPREADIAWRMTLQSDKTLPELAGTPFLEKPPLSYWMSAAGLRLFGESPGAARAPNILYAAITTLAIGALALRMAGAVTAILAAIVTATMLLVFRVTVWLAPDAGLLAGVTVSLLGVYLGYTAPIGRRKLLGYCLLHLGAALGFMAKSAPGWMAPALTLSVLIAWERRWSEVARWELYAGFVLQVLVIGPWILAVTHTDQGKDALLALFWHNVVGRFTKVSAPAALDYSTGHKNSPGKYLIELPVYLLPWTLLVVAALRRAWDRTRVTGPDGTAWRFAVSAALPFLFVLSIAATARDIYAAPGLLGFGVLVALWMNEVRHAPSAFDGWMIRATRWLVMTIACGFVLLAAAVAFASAALTHLWAPALVLLFSVATIRRSARAQERGDVVRSFGWTCTSYVTAVCITALVTFPTIDRSHDLATLARRIGADSKHYDLALLDPDETTLAMMDYRLRTPFTILTLDPSSAHAQAAAVSNWLNAHGSSARVLVLLPGHASGELTRLLEHIHSFKAPDDGIAGTLKSQGVASLVRRYELPQGRRYALLGPSQSR